MKSIRINHFVAFISVYEPLKIPPPTKNNQLDENVGLKDTKNEEPEVRNESETTRHKFPDFFAVPDFKLPEATHNKSMPAFWNKLNIDALCPRIMGYFFLSC